MLADAELRGASLLVLANKSDLPNALPVAEVAQKLALDKLGSRRQWCARTPPHRSHWAFAPARIRFRLSRQAKSRGWCLPTELLDII